MKKNLILFLACTATLIFSCKEKTKKTTQVETAKVKFEKEGTLTFLRQGDTLQILTIEIADNSYEKQTGLMYRESMKPNRGMLFIYKNERPRPNFYMKNTEFPLDLIYISADHKIVDFNENAHPFNKSPLPSRAPAQFVLEVNAGKVDEWGLKKGDQIKFTRLSEKE